MVGRPNYSASSTDGDIVLTLVTDESLEGKTCIYFLRSGLTGKVLNLGGSTVDENGDCIRELHLAPGRRVQIYGKVNDVDPNVLPDPRTPDHAFIIT